MTIPKTITEIEHEILKSMIGYVVNLRSLARNSGDYRKADIIRNMLSKMHVIVEDTRNGTQWHWKAEGE